MADKGNPPTTPPSEADEAFLARWSRRKHQVGQGRLPARAEAQPEPSDVDASAGRADAEPADPAPAADDASLPPPESLESDSDFSAYLSARVSSGLRRAALKRLFSLPEFNVRDGLDDYDDDYTAFKSLGDTLTADMKHHAERLRERRAQAAANEADADRDNAPAADADQEPRGPRAPSEDERVDTDPGSGEPGSEEPGTAQGESRAAGEQPDDPG